MAKGAQAVRNAIFRHVERILKIKPGERQISYLQTELRNEGKAQTFIEGYMRHLRSSLSWAKCQKLLATIPEIELKKRTGKKKLMRGRPITTEEFDRMIVAAKVQRPKDAEVWTHYLNGLWLSGRAHDLRRAFGSRWAKHVMPVILQKMMRHEA